MIGIYLNGFNTIDYQNRIRKSELALEKHCVTHNGHFILITTVVLGMGIIDVKILFCCGISKKIKD